jgi:hypothetical protein
MPEFITDQQFELSRGAGELLLDLEAILAEAVESLAPLVALGRPGEQIGAGRISCQDDKWRGILELLANNAEHICVLPTDSPGTRWEMEHIRGQGLLAKCFFLMPPENQAFGWKGRWEHATAALEEYGLRLPEYQNNGMIFTAGQDGMTQLRRAFGEGQPVKEIQKHIRRIMEGFGDPPEEPVLHCPNCASPYRRSDYRADAPAVFCSSCKEELPSLLDQDS